MANLNNKNNLRIGTAGWAIAGVHKEKFSTTGSHLEKYSQVFNAVEINSSFYRDHQAKTYRRWSEAVPENFQFSVKLNKIFTHEKRLEVNKDEVCACLESVRELNKKWGALLIQLPPSLTFDLRKAQNFFGIIRSCYEGLVVVEPRHLSWQRSAQLLKDYKIFKVSADPEPCPMDLADSQQSPHYFRWHGSPEIYKSNYSTETLLDWGQKVAAFSANGEVWCIFDNTAFFHATQNALDFQKIIEEKIEVKKNSSDPGNAPSMTSFGHRQCAFDPL